MDFLRFLASSAIIVYIVLPCLSLLIFYAIIRVAVSRGMRDHQRWMEKNRPSLVNAMPQRATIGQYRDPEAPAAPPPSWN